jgi:hypothetical protein
VYCYFITFLAVAVLIPATPLIFFRMASFLAPATPLVAPMAEGNTRSTLPIRAGAERIVTIDLGTIYIGDDGGVGLEYKKEFTVISLGDKNILSLQVAGIVGAINDADSDDYRHGFYADKLYINDAYIDNLNNYCFQQEDQQFRTILVALPPHVLSPGPNKLSIIATGPKDDNHDDFVLREIKLLQWEKR